MPTYASVSFRTQNPEQSVLPWPVSEDVVLSRGSRGLAFISCLLAGIRITMKFVMHYLRGHSFKAVESGTVTLVRESNFTEMGRAGQWMVVIGETYTVKLGMHDAFSCILFFMRLDWRDVMYHERECV